MLWTALIPFKTKARKSRLAGRLSETDREQLAGAMYRHVMDTLVRSPSVGRILTLPDAGLGLNAELAAARHRLIGEPLLVIHADLPFLTTDDIEALLQAAAPHGGAIAPDRHDTGTNALALPRGTGFRFAFGPNSFARHHRPGMRIVRCPGLSHDIDTPVDLDSSAAISFDSLEQAH